VLQIKPAELAFSAHYNIVILTDLFNYHSLSIDLTLRNTNDNKTN